MSEHSSGVYITKAEAEERLTELRDDALADAEDAAVNDAAEEATARARAGAFRLAMGIVHNIREEPF